MLYSNSAGLQQFDPDGERSMWCWELACSSGMRGLEDCVRTAVQVG